MLDILIPILVVLLIFWVLGKIGQILIAWGEPRAQKEHEERTYRERELSALEGMSEGKQGSVVEPSLTERLLEANKQILVKRHEREDRKAVDELLEQLDKKS